MHPLISILIPHYNTPNKLASMLQSIARQTLKDLEVIVVDDFSTDSCTGVVEAFQNKGLPVRLLTTDKRIYTLQARLRGVAAAKAEIIAFADADDQLWGTDTLEMHVNKFLQEEPDVLHFPAVLTDEKGTFSMYAPLSLPLAPVLTGTAIFEKFSVANIWGNSCLWNKLFSRDLVMQVQNIAQKSSILRHVEDLYLMSYYLFHAKKYIGSNSIGYGYYFKDKMDKDAYERSLYTFYILNEIPIYLENHGCSKETIAAYVKNVQEYFRSCAGKMCISMFHQYGDIIPDAVLNQLAHRASPETIAKMLILANRLNAQIILDTFHALYQLP